MDPQTPDKTSDHLVPFRWPSAWTDPALLGSFSQNPINCLIFENVAAAKPVADAARAAGLTVLEWNSLGAAPLAEVKWDSPNAQTVITSLEWPRIKLSRKSDTAVDAGPTGAPWIDSNTWVARLAAVRAPRRPVWLGFELGKGDPVPGASDYTIAIADTAATGARWMVSLDDGLRKGLPAGNVEAQKIWRSILTALAFFEKHRDWTAWEHWGSIGILSSFAGKDEFLGVEVLNLSARRNLLYRILDRSVPASLRLEGLRAVLYVDSDSPSPELKAKLNAFARAGGLLIVPHALATGFAGDKPVECPVTGYDLRSFGKGAVAVARRDWDDPFFLAADVHSLVRRRNDPVTLFNARSLWEHYSVAPDDRAALLQLVAFTNYPNESVSVAPARRWRSATLHTIGSSAEVELKPLQVAGRPEFHLPAFSYYAALEFRS
jgi:hypothetical protein